MILVYTNNRDAKEGKAVDYLADKERVRQNLIDAGCGSGMISDFFDGEIRNKISLLYNHRRKLLEDFHRLQKEIDCLDYLILQMKNSE